MSARQDLFVDVAPPWSRGMADREGWERRALRDLVLSPLVYCYPGFMGAICERLVGKGLASKSAAGFLAPPEGMDARTVKAWGYRAKDHPLFCYEITPAGLAWLGNDFDVI